MIRKIGEAWRRRYGVAPTISHLSQLSAGASASTWRFVCDSSRGSEVQVMQLFAGGENFGFALGKAAQGRVQQAAHQAGVPTPPVTLIVGAGDGLPEGFVSPFVPGETLGNKIIDSPALEHARAALAEQSAVALARIHRMEPALVPDLPIRSAAEQLQELAVLHRSYGQHLPVFETALAWLAEHLPEPVQAHVVHGDFRTGNLMVNASGLAAVLDWELAHLGDPMEDLGWLCMRSWRFGRDDLAAGGFARRQTFFEHYASAAGQVPDPAVVRYWETFAALKWGVICQWFARQYLSGAVRELERVVIGRRVSETELVLLDLIEGHDC